MLGKTEGKEEKGTTEDETVGWHHQLNGRESEQTLGDGKGQRSLSILEKEMATHSYVLAWRSPWTEETGTLQSIALPSTGHD